MSDYDRINGYFNAGRWFLQAGRRQRALLMVGAIREHNPSHPLAEQLLAEIYRERKRHVKRHVVVDDGDAE